MICVFTGKELENLPSIYDQIFRLRKKVFKDHLDWDVNTRFDYEFDEYDTPETMYIVSMVDGKLAAMWRILPTTSPYMIDGPFKSLIPDHLIPHRKDTWELSRFCIDHDVAKTHDHRMMIATEIAIGMGEYCLLKGIREIISIQSPELTALCNQAFGLPRFITPPKKFGVAYASVTIYQPDWQRLLFNGRESLLLPSPVLARVPEQFDHIPTNIHRSSDAEITEKLNSIKISH